MASFGKGSVRLVHGGGVDDKRGELYYPSALAVTPSSSAATGEALLVCTSAPSVQLLSASSAGGLLASKRVIGEAGTAGSPLQPGEYLCPSALATSVSETDGPVVYVSDSQAHAVHKFRVSDGLCLASAGGAGSGAPFRSARRDTFPRRVRSARMKRLSVGHASSVMYPYQSKHLLAI